MLCTYNKATDANIVRLAQNNYDARTNNDSPLIEYIRDNFHLLAASDFSISYKLNNQIYNFSLSSDKIKNMKSIKELSTLLSKKYQDFVKFYENIHLKYHESYPEIFNSNLETKPKELEHADLIRVFNRVLTIEAYNFNKSSLNKIKTILNQEGLSTEFALSGAIKKENFELLIYLLNYKNTSVSLSNLNKAIKKGDLDVLKAVLDHPTTKDSYIIALAESTNDSAVIELVKNYNTTINIIKTEESIVDTTILEEVPALGEAPEEVA